MTDRFDTLIAMIAQSIQGEDDALVEEINRRGRERAEALADKQRMLRQLLAVVTTESERFATYLPPPAPTPRAVPRDTTQPVQRLAQTREAAQ